MTASPAGFILATLLALVSPIALAETLPDDADTAIARRHFAEGVRHYDRDDYAEALREFEAVREVKPLPEVDFNIGRCLDRMERYAEAIEAYRRYVQGARASVDADQAQARIQVLQDRLAARQAATRKARPSAPLDEDSPSAEPDRGPAPAVPLPAASPAGRTIAWPPALPAPSRPGPTRSLIPGVLVAVGSAALIGSGIGLIASIGPDYEQLHMSCAPDCSHAQADALRAREWIGDALLGVGGALVVVDLLLWLLPTRRAPSETRLWFAPTAGGVVAGGRF